MIILEKKKKMNYHTYINRTFHLDLLGVTWQMLQQLKLEVQKDVIKNYKKIGKSSAN